MSRDLGLSNSAYSQWNTRKSKPAKKTIHLMAPYLETTVEYLLTGVETQQKSPPPDGDGRSAKEIVLEKVDEIAANGDEQALWEIFERLSQRMQKK